MIKKFGWIICMISVISVPLSANTVVDSITLHINEIRRSKGLDTIQLDTLIVQCMKKMQLNQLKTDGETGYLSLGTREALFDCVWDIKVKAICLTANNISEIFSANNINRFLELKSILMDNEYNTYGYLNVINNAGKLSYYCIFTKRFVDIIEAHFTKDLYIDHMSVLWVEWKGVSRLPALFYKIIEIPQSMNFASISSAGKNSVTINKEKEFSLPKTMYLERRNGFWQGLALFSEKGEMVAFLPMKH